MMHEAMRDKAKNSMRLILEAAGFDVEDADPPLDLSAIRDEESVIVLCSDDPAQIALFEKTQYSLALDEEEVPCTKLLFTLDESVKVSNCLVWGAREFARYAGEAIVADLLDRQLLLRLVPGVGELRGVPPPQPGTGQTVTGGDTGGGGNAIPHFPIKVNKQQAERISGIQGSAGLRFMPYWVYHFSSSGEQVFRDRRIPFDAEGSGAINAINGIRIEVDPAQIEQGEVMLNAEIVPSHITQEEATERVIEETIARLTQKVRIKQEKGDAIFYEEKVLRPDRRNIKVEVSEAFIPVWQIRGKKIVEVNGVTGEILSEPMDEGVEIL